MRPRSRLYLGMFLMFLSALLTAAGQAYWKSAMHGLLSWQLYVGFLCYGLGAILMTLAFRFGSLSVLHPLLSIGYVFSIVIGFEFLHERITIHEVVGDAIIILGAVFMGLGGRREQVDE